MVAYKSNRSRFSTSRLLTAGLAGALGIGAANSEALDINFTYVSSGNEPSWDPSGAQLLSLANDAAVIWEDIFHQSQTVNVNLSWDSYTSSSTLASATALTIGGDGLPETGRLKFNSAQPWWFDSTPFNNAEFNMQQVLYGDLDLSDKSDWYSGSVPDLLEVSYNGTSNGSTSAVSSNFDGLTVMLHELGHVLALSSSMSSGEAGTDGDFDVPSVLVDGRNVNILAATDSDGSINHAHTAASSVMDPSVGKGQRWLPSATDVFAMAAAAPWDTSKIDLDRQDFWSGTYWGTPGNWEGNMVPGSGDDAYIRLELDMNDAVANLYVGRGSSLDLNSYAIDG